MYCGWKIILTLRAKFWIVTIQMKAASYFAVVYIIQDEMFWISSVNPDWDELINDRIVMQGVSNVSVYKRVDE